MYNPSGNTWNAWKQRMAQWKASSYKWVNAASTASTNTSTTAGSNQMAVFQNSFYNGTGSTTSATTTGPSYSISTGATSATNTINITASGTTGSSITWSDVNVVHSGREITEDEKIQKLVDMEEQLQKMKEALDEALHMNRKLMVHKHDDRRMALLEKRYSTRVEVLQEEADTIVEEAEEIMIFSG